MDINRYLEKVKIVEAGHKRRKGYRIAYAVFEVPMMMVLEYHRENHRGKNFDFNGFWNELGLASRLKDKASTEKERRALENLSGDVFVRLESMSHKFTLVASEIRDGISL